MSNEFTIGYDNGTSKSAPALDDYEKSVFLTDSLYTLLNIAIAPLAKEGITIQSEMLKKLRTSYETSSQIGESATRKRLASNAVFYARDPNIYHIDLEQVKLVSDDPYLNGWVSQVVPVPYDRFHRVLRNPYLGPQRDRVLRVDSGLEGASDIVQLIPPPNATINSYLIQYIRKPYPIILADLSLEFPGEGLSVYGETKPYSATEATDVSEIVQKEIVKGAIELAILHFKENSLSNNLQIK
jgi:hypothetical protein